MINQQQYTATPNTVAQPKKSGIGGNIAIGTLGTGALAAGGLGYKSGSIAKNIGEMADASFASNMRSMGVSGGASKVNRKAVGLIGKWGKRIGHAGMGAGLIGAGILGRRIYKQRQQRQQGA